MKVLQVDEATLTILLQSKSIKRFNLMQEAGGYGVFLTTVTGERGMLVTDRDKTKPRRRISVDTFIKYLGERADDLPKVVITFTGGKHTDDDEDD